MNERARKFLEEKKRRDEELKTKLDKVFIRVGLLCETKYTG